MIHAMLEMLSALLILVGSFFGLVGAIGLVRLPDFFSRLHAPTKASTLGVGGVLLAALVQPVAAGGVPGWHELLLTLFVFITAPVSANLLAQAGISDAGARGSLPVADAVNGATVSGPIGTGAPRAGEPRR